MEIKLDRQRKEHYYNTVKFITEFSLIPLHYLALMHAYTAAISIGCIGLFVFIFVTYLLHPFE